MYAKKTQALNIFRAGPGIFAGIMTVLFLQSAGAESVSEAIDQEVTVALEQKIQASGIHDKNPLNSDNWQNQNEWEANMAADIDWYIGWSDRFQGNLGGDLRWKEGGGTYRSADGAASGESEFRLTEALLSFNLWEADLRILAGKTMRTYGTAVMLPVTDFLYRDSINAADGESGKVMAGMLFTKGIFSLDAWYTPDVEWIDGQSMILLNSVVSFDVHRLGLVYYHNGANTFGAYYSGQIGDSVIPYAEAALSDHALLRPLSSLIGENGTGGSWGTDDSWGTDNSWSTDAVVGFSFVPPVLNVSVYCEYRYRSSGYSEKDWEDLSNMIADPVFPINGSPQDMGAYAQQMGEIKNLRGKIAEGLPYFMTSVHTLGIHLQNSRQIADRFDYTLNAFYLFPDGLFFRGEIFVSLLDRMKITAGGTFLEPLDNRGEMIWWNKKWQVDLSVKWTARTAE